MQAETERTCLLDRLHMRMIMDSTDTILLSTHHHHDLHKQINSMALCKSILHSIYSLSKKRYIVILKLKILRVPMTGNYIKVSV